MNRTHLLVVAAVVSALSVVACASGTPDQQQGLTTYERTMSQADADKLVNEIKQQGAHCYKPCSVSPPDANGDVVFQAILNCAGAGTEDDNDAECTVLYGSMCD